MRRSFQILIALSACVFLLSGTHIKRVQTERHRGTYPAGFLAGRKFASLNCDWSGFCGRVPTMLTIDCDNNLDRVWEHKKNRSRGNSVVSQTARTVVAEYHLGNPQRVSVAKFQQEAHKEAALVYDHLDWQKVGTLYRLPPRKLAVLKRAAHNIRGRSLVSYSMTELLPTKDGAFNREYYGFLLRHCGRAYIERLPALYDDYTSFGTYQFTRKALYDAGGRREGASVVNQALPQRYRIPGSVNKLRGNNHFRAAYLFGVSNLALMVRGLNERQLRVLERVADTRAIDLAEFMAVAHNKPAAGRRSARRWLDSNARLPYHTSLPPVSRLYATKTLANYNALSPTV